ncbi:methyl-accepting chemotaxis protein [Phaeobacter sp. HF9A]|uniref:methyl-accepting chemotaxis protein n=1 Tax=Phaeobacter sp. HF9A TaxID=2721561 RepID=UPI001430811D|nr:methyl-accepting chemotaxis protein [Phaeobacter sp. HF9A]NIZ13725.1 HAMP domain-containing protein [Phaeobacter sp. HF9A]
MSNFSIRTQVFIFAGAFIAMLLAIEGMSWFTTDRLTRAIQDARLVSTQLKSLDDMKEDIEQGIGDIYSYALGKKEGLAGLRGNMDEVRAEIDLADTRFIDVPAHMQNREIFDKMQALKGNLDALEGELKSLEGVSGYDLWNVTSDTIQPMIAALRDEVNGLQDSMGADKAEVDAQISTLFRVNHIIQLATSIAAAVISVIVALVFGRQLSRPVAAAAESIQALSEQAYDKEITGTDRGDELGRIARNLEDLRDRLSEADRAEQKAREENDMRVALFDVLSTSMSGRKNGDLNQMIPPQDWQQLGSSYTTLCADFNGLAESLSDLVMQLTNSSNEVGKNAAEMERMSDQMSQRAETQAATLEQSAAALEEMSASVQSSAQQAQQADREVEEGRRRAEQGGEVMEQARQAMASIAEHSHQITQIITSIDDIAFQTSLLALNAGVEAARAGEAGRGFAVVASEVRGLALKAAQSASEIKKLVESSSSQVQEGERLVQATAETLAEIVESVTNVSGMVSAIASSSNEQAAGIKEINIGVAQLDKVTQQNAVMVQESYNASQGMRTQASRLSDLLQGFSGKKEQLVYGDDLGDFDAQSAA